MRIPAASLGILAGISRSLPEIIGESLRLPSLARYQRITGGARFWALPLLLLARCRFDTSGLNLPDGFGLSDSGTGKKPPTPDLQVNPPSDVFTGTPDLSHDAPVEPDAGEIPPDAGVRPDRDTTPTDASRIDAPPDGQTVDLSPDTRPDTGIDAPPSPPDLGPDVGPDAGIPAPPVLLRPAEALLLAPTRAFLLWNDGFIPAGETPYHYRTCFTTDGAEAIADESLCPNSTTVASRHTLLDPLIRSAVYFWKVQTCLDEDETTCTPFSEIRSFSTDNSVVGWWRFDVATNLGLDSSPSGINGDLLGSPPPSYVSNNGLCGSLGAEVLLGGGGICFDGETHAVFLGDILDSMSQLTVEARLRTTASSGTIVNKYLNATDSSYQLSVNDGRVYFSTTTSGEAVGALTGTRVYDGNWHHVVGSYDGVSQSVFVDGNLGATEAQSEGIQNNTRPLCIGAGCDNSTTPPTTSQLFQGLLDEVLIYNRGLSDAEVLNKYCADRALLSPEEVPPAECLD